MDIRGRLVGLAVGATIPLILAVVVDIWGTWTDTRRHIDDSLTQQVDFAALAFEHWLDVQRQPLITAASHFGLNGSDQKQILESILVPRTQWTDLRVVDEEGTTLFSNPADIEELPAGIVERLLVEIKEGRRAVETDWTRGEGKYLLAIAEPLRSGAIIARIDGATVADVFRYLELPTESLITLLDPQRRVIYRSYDAESFIGAEISSSGLFRLLEAQSGPVITEEQSLIDDTERVYAAARAGSSNYVVTIGVPSASLYEPARRQLMIQLLLILGALFWTLIAALIIARSVVKPLRRLVFAARSFGKGNLSARAPVRGYDEIIELGRTFNEMAASIGHREARLKELDQLKSDFVSSVSHELRTPLTTIKTLTQLMLRRQMTETERNESLETISAECDRQIDLVSNLLDLNRIESGALDSSRAPVDPASVVSDCIRLQRQTAELRDHSLLEEIGRDLPTIYTDRVILRRVLCTLIENAIKYTPAGGRIRVGTRITVGRRVVFYVDDNGIGIAAAELPHIFQKFYRAGGGRDTEDEARGVGLGLYLAQNLIEHLGGHIEVSSRVGQGSTFTITFPLDAVARESKPIVGEETRHVTAATAN